MLSGTSTVLFMLFFWNLSHLLLSCPVNETYSGGALQLLRPNDVHNRTSLSVVEETLRYIEKLEGPVAVLAIVGPYHTGKSFLLNQVVRSLSAGRGVGGGTRAESPSGP
jgi:polynucleotide 5'-kinase involved in rRNA processing